MKRLILILILSSLASAAGAQPNAATLPPPGPDMTIDYADPANWLCRPGRTDDACGADLDAVAFDRAGTRKPSPFAAAADPKVDCFYVYPTVSTDPTFFSDMAPGPGERRAAEVQFARFRSVCRLFAPIYRSMTLPALRAMVAGARLPEGGLDHGRNYDDVAAAWRSYLARDNRGRGVVLIEHSQGAGLLKRLIAEEIDGKPAQKLLVGAYLAGNLELTVADGKATGGSFRSVPLCTRRDQAGCVVAWSTYSADDAAPVRMFGGNGGAAGLVGACVNPADPAGGEAPLDGFVPRPSMAPASDPPYVEQVGQLTGRCVADARGNVFRVTVAEGPLAGLIRAGLNRRALPGWGLHLADISLVQGNLIDLVRTQSAAWAARRQGSLTP